MRALKHTSDPLAFFSQHETFMNTSYCMRTRKIPSQYSVRLVSVSAYLLFRQCHLCVDTFSSKRIFCGNKFQMCVERKFATEYNSGLEALPHIYPGNAFACNRMKIFDHYGIFVGWIDGVAYAIHFSGKVLSNTCIRFDKFLEITGDSKVRVFSCSDTKNPLQLFGKVPCDPIKVLHRAMERLGDGEYNVATWNCESYVNWVFYRIGVSSQSVKAAPKAVLVATVAMVNPVHTIVAGNIAKTFLDSSLRDNTNKFLKKQNELKEKIEQIIATKGIQGLVETARTSNFAIQNQPREKGAKVILDKVREVCHTRHF